MEILLRVIGRRAHVVERDIVFQREYVKIAYIVHVSRRAEQMDVVRRNRHVDEDKLDTLFFAEFGNFLKEIELIAIDVFVRACSARCIPVRC